jgi:hypothetical protein
MKNLLYRINITPFAVAIITINLLQVLNYQNLTANTYNINVDVFALLK